MYKSFQTIEATGYGVTQKDHTEVTVEQLEACVQILMYWVVYTFFTVGRNFHAENVSTHVNQPKAEWLYACAVGEYFSDYLLFWIPFYYFLKLGALLWFIKGEGAKKVYLLFCGLILKKYEPHIDKVMRIFQLAVVCHFESHGRVCLVGCRGDGLSRDSVPQRRETLPAYCALMAPYIEQTHWHSYVGANWRRGTHRKPQSTIFWSCS
eukprot:SAG31_NODE_1139_length_9713_cov_28.936863_5_plen_208_part_00